MPGKNDRGGVRGKRETFLVKGSYPSHGRKQEHGKREERTHILGSEQFERRGRRGGEKKMSRPPSLEGRWRGWSPPGF